MIHRVILYPIQLNQHTTKVFGAFEEVHFIKNIYDLNDIINRHYTKEYNKNTAIVIKNIFVINSDICQRICEFKKTLNCSIFLNISKFNLNRICKNIRMYIQNIDMNCIENPSPENILNLDVNLDTAFTNLCKECA